MAAGSKRGTGNISRADCEIEYTEKGMSILFFYVD